MGGLTGGGDVMVDLTLKGLFIFVVQETLSCFKDFLKVGEVS